MSFAVPHSSTGFDRIARVSLLFQATHLVLFLTKHKRNHIARFKAHLYTTTFHSLPELSAASYKIAGYIKRLINRWAGNPKG